MFDTIKIFKRIFQSKIVFDFRIAYEIIIWKFKLKNHKDIPNTFSDGQKTILIATSIGENLNALALDLVLGIALRSRGHKVYFLLCNKALPACMNCEYAKFKNIEEFQKVGAKKLCNKCVSKGRKILKSFDLQIIKIEKSINYVSKLWDNEVAESGAKRFLAIGRVTDVNEYEKVFKKFFDASQILNGQMNRIFDDYAINTVIAHHGIYVPQANIINAAKEHKIEVITWVQGYRKQTFIFSKNDTYHKTLLKDNPKLSYLSESNMKKINQYLASRDLGNYDWIRFGNTNKFENSNIEIGKNKRKILLLTNVSWDAQLHYSSRIFSDMHEWILETIKWFIKKPELDLIIRTHPAEKSGKIISRDPIVPFIRKNFAFLPENIILVEPDARISTYYLMDQCDLGLIFATKAGIELAALGIPIIVTGESWIREKGLSNDPKSRKDYFEMLENFNLEPNSLYRNKSAAIAFAYNFFYRRSIEINSVKPINRFPYIRPNIKSDWQINDHGLLKLIKGIESGSDELFFN